MGLWLRSAARAAKASMWWRRAWVIRMRPWLERWRASCSAENSPAEPGIATDMNRSFPRILCQCFSVTRVREARSWNSWAISCLRWAGSSMVCRMVSSSHPRITLRVDQLLSPFSSFLRDTASLRLCSETPGCARMLSMPWKRCWRRAFIRRRLPCPNCIKSSTKTSVSPSGRLSRKLEGGAMSSGS